MELKSISDIKRSLEAGQLNARELIEACILAGKEFRIHPLGFVASSILVEKNFKARLHIWPSIGLHEQSVDCTIHDHVFDFTSWVLAGAVENIEYPDFKVGGDRLAYSTTYSGIKSVLTKTNMKVELGRAVKKTISKGESYIVKSGCLHETRLAGESGAITLLITRETGKTNPMVIGADKGKYQYEFERRVIGLDELRDYLNGVC